MLSQGLLIRPTFGQTRSGLIHESVQVAIQVGYKKGGLNSRLVLLFTGLKS